MLFLDDSDATHIFKDKGKLNTIKKSTYCTCYNFVFLWNPIYIFLEILSLIKGSLYLSPGIAITTCDRWKTEKKTVTTNSIIVKKQWKWRKGSLVPLKPLAF